MGKLEEYLKLFTSDYDSAVETLLNKYGKVPDSYFQEDSFNSFCGRSHRPQAFCYTKWRVVDEFHLSRKTLLILV